jgi:hypothetical protein
MGPRRRVAPLIPYHIDGAASILVGIAANQSLATRRMVHIEDLFPLPEKVRR